MNLNLQDISLMCTRSNCSMRFYDKYYNENEKFGEDKCYTHENIQNKIQCFASMFALNNTVEDMNSVQKEGCFVFELTYHQREVNENTDHTFSCYICKKNEKQNIHRKDYSFAFPHAHIFFEIPVVRNFSPEQVIKWQLWAYEECKRLVYLNMKKRDSWLKKKQLNEDFAEDEKSGN